VSITALPETPRAGRAPEPAWLGVVRREGRARFDALGYPTTRQEDWRFTDVGPIAKAGFEPVQSGGELDPDVLSAYLFDHAEWPRLVFLNGRFQAGLSRLEGLPAGVRLAPLARVLVEEPALVEPVLGKVATQPAAAAFTALNAAELTEGYVLHVPAGVVLATPVHVVVVSDAEATGGVTHLRNVVALGANAEASVVESYLGVEDSAGFVNVVTEGTLADGARLDHCRIQRETERAFHVGTVEVRQERNSYFNSFSFALGAALSRTNIYTLLDGPGAHATLHGLYVAHRRQHVDHQTRIEHAAPDCTSWEVYKGILDGHSRAVFNGKVYVRPEAQKTDGKQTNKNLLLSEHAKVDTKPQLEIYADDVKCTHGATVGRLDDVALFYLLSRGIPKADARTLLTYGFAADVLEEIRSRPVVEHLEALMMERLTAGQMGGLADGQSGSGA